MITTKDLSIAELKRFRQKMISVYDNSSNGGAKADASIVLSMIEGELLERGIEIDDEEEISLRGIFRQWLMELRIMFSQYQLRFTKDSPY